MGNAAYDELRAKELEQRNQRVKDEEAAAEVARLLVSALRDFIEGKACLFVEACNNGTTIRFSRG